MNLSSLLNKFIFISAVTISFLHLITAQSEQIDNTIVVSKAPSSSLQDECDDLDLMGHLLPINNLLRLFQRAVRGDPEQQSLTHFLQSPELSSIVQNMARTASGSHLNGIIRGIGVDVGNTIDRMTTDFRSLMRTPTEYDEEEIELPPAVGLGGMVKHLANLIPSEKILRCYNLRFNANPLFRGIFDSLNSPELRNIFQHLRRTEQFSSLASQLNERGTEFNGILNQGLNFFRIPPA